MAEVKPKKAPPEKADAEKISEAARKFQESIAASNKLAIKRGYTDGPVVSTIADHSIRMGKSIRTGIDIFDALTGGLPCGCSSLVWGEDGGGKTAFCLNTAATVLKDDAEHRVLMVMAEAAKLDYMAPIAGLDVKDPRFALLDAHGSGENAFEIMREFLVDGNKPKNIVKLIILDSLAGLEPADIRKKVLKDGAEASADVGRVAAMYAKFFREINSTKAVGTGHLLMTSQVRIDINAYGRQINVGGRAANHQVRFNVKLSKGEGVYRNSKDKENKVNPIGHEVEVNVVKDGYRGLLQGRKFKYGVHYGRGPDNIGSYVQMLEMGGGFSRPSASYYQCTPELIQFFDGPADAFLKINGAANARKAMTDPVMANAARKWLDWKMSTGGILQITDTADADAMEDEDLGAGVETDDPTQGMDPMLLPG